MHYVVAVVFVTYCLLATLFRNLVLVQLTFAIDCLLTMENSSIKDYSLKYSFSGSNLPHLGQVFNKHNNYNVITTFTNSTEITWVSMN